MYPTRRAQVVGAAECGSLAPAKSLAVARTAAQLRCTEYYACNSGLRCQLPLWPQRGMVLDLMRFALNRKTEAVALWSGRQTQA